MLLSEVDRMLYQYKTRPIRHDREREAPLPLYLGLLLHNKTWERELIANLFHNGLSVSYRDLQLSRDEANRAIDYIF